MKSTFLILLCLSVWEPAVIAQNQPLSTPAATDRFVTRLMDKAGIPGLSLALIRQNTVVYSQGYGLTKADSTQRVTPATVFDAASLSKPVFAYAVLQLVEAGKLDLDKPLYEYLPYADVAADERYKKITARLVLSHASGLPNWRKNRQSNQLAMRYNPGERFGYSGEGFVYLQKVVEKITGKPINELMIERVFKPLQMTRSSYVWQPAFEADFAYPHDKESQPEDKGRFTQPNMAYSLQTTADDYARFVLALLTANGLKPATVDQMLSHQRQLPKTFSGTEPLSPGLFWGLGIGIESTPTGDYFWHWGDNGTFRCYVTADRKRGDGIVYFTNSFNGLDIADDMVQQFIGGEHPAPPFLGID
ncbi:serine hydrolase [Spirosoma sp. 209]|uniref:serine hydrolase domain-containing protein n=1 Tax=Spirosoma sp. 209 TaxID=1955701 RepID=UPI00098D42AB|nr:serine hydrolase domain-containing protein [Spirosoma sp. 209]